MEQEGIGLENIMHKLDLDGLLDDEHREDEVSRRMLGDVDNRDDITGRLSLHQALGAGQDLWVPMETKMTFNERHRIIQTEERYL
jgi:hypothetical protein